MNKVIPILRDSLTPLITLLMEMLTSCVASKNNSIYNAAMEVLISLTKFVGKNDKFVCDFLNKF